MLIHLQCNVCYVSFNKIALRSHKQEKEHEIILARKSFISFIRKNKINILWLNIGLLNIAALLLLLLHVCVTKSHQTSTLSILNVILTSSWHQTSWHHKCHFMTHSNPTAVTVLCLVSHQPTTTIKKYHWNKYSSLEFYFHFISQQMLILRSDESRRMLQLISYSQFQSVSLMIIRIPAI